MNKNLSAFIIAISVIIFCFTNQNIQAQSSKEIYVAPSGNDKNSGTIDQPIASISKAKALVNEWKKKESNSTEGVTVYLRGGNYTITNSIDFTKDAGSEGKPIIYTTYKNEEVHLNAGISINASLWKPLNEAAKKRVHPSVNPSKLVALDVASLHLTNTQAFAPKNQFTTDWFIIDVFANSVRQPIAQWPNQNENVRGKNEKGYVTCNGTKDERSFYYGSGGNPQDKDTANELNFDGTYRSARWKNALESGHEVWLKGLWRTPWEPRTLKVESINTENNYIQFYDVPSGGMGSKYAPKASEQPAYTVGNGRENWFAINLLEEIDQPGEWALDIKDQVLYFYPPSDIKKLEMVIADRKMPIINCNNTSNLQFIGLQIENGLANGISITNSNNILVAACTIKNVGNSGIYISGGLNNTIQSNNIYETAGFGIDIKNVGNRKTLSDGKLSVVNNHIHHVGRLAFKQSISVSNSVGVTIAHNLLHDIPTAAIRTDDINNCLFEYNEIHNIAQKESDNGVFYSYGGWSTYGNIFRYNFSHHTNRSNGLYSDDGTSGNVYYKNIVQGCIGGVVFGGGHDNIAENNLFIESKAQGIDDRGKDRNYRLGTKYETRLTQFNLNAEPWKSYAEKLMSDFKLTTHLWDDVLKPEWHPEFPNGCRMANNVAVASGKFKQPKNGEVVVKDNISLATIDEAAFYNYAEMDLRTKNAQILDKYPEINDVFLKMGLQKDAYRNVIPTRKETGGLANRGSEADLKNEDQFIDKVKPTTIKK